MRRDQPGVYLKVIALLIPREHEVEHRGGVKGMTEEQIIDAIEAIEGFLARRAGEQAKVIEGIAEPTALHAPELGPQRKRPNRLLEHADSAVGPQERKLRKVPSPTST